MTKKANPKENPYLTLVRSFTPAFYKECRIKLHKRQVLYYDEEGNKTPDVSKAILTPFGKPVVAGLTEKAVLLAEPVISRITFNPRDPLARQRAFSARASFMDMVSSGNDYRDKFDNLSYANNVANKVIDIFNSNNNPKTDIENEN